MTTDLNAPEMTQEDIKIFQQANDLRTKGNYAEASLLYQNLSHRFPHRADFLFMQAICLHIQKEYLNAIGAFVKAIELDPENAEYQASLARSIAANGNKTLAIKVYKRALKIDPDNVTALSGISLIYLSRYQNQAAADCLKHAHELQPSNFEINLNLADALSRTGHYEEALKLANKLIRQTPNNTHLYKCIGDIYQMHGHIKEALQAYRKALSLDSSNVTVYYDIVTTEKVKNPNDEIIKKMEKALTKGMTSQQRQYLLFAIANAYNDCKEWDKAFSYLDKANMLVHSSYDPKVHKKTQARLKSIFNQNYFIKLELTKNKADSPIFIVGMPRSGSTLIDQILSSHSRVKSVGESMEIREIVSEISEQNPTINYPDCLCNISETELDEYRNQYLSATKREAGDAEYIVDKMPFNFNFLGLIVRMFPNAKFIHSMRHPLDICLSCYMTGFAMTDETWAHNLQYIGQFYREYHNLMAHWHKVLPTSILDVKYEDLVNDVENNIRRILDFCGLEWEPGCLEFYNAKRSVITASVTQVRQPIYKSSVARWVPYAKHLQPLITALGDILKDDTPRLQELGLTVNIKQPLLQRMSAFFHS